MKRRNFIKLAGGAALASAMPGAARAQRAGSKPTVGVLMAGGESQPDNQKRIAAFRAGLADLGWKDGENIQLDVRWSNGKRELITQHAKELVALAPDVILANSTPVIGTFKSLTSSIPVVFALAMDPVGLGQVESLARPGGNFTGFTFIDPELIGKWMALLKDMAPSVTRAAILFNPSTVHAYVNFIQEIKVARQPGAIELVAMPAASDGEMEKAIGALAQQPGSGLIIGPDPFNQVRLKRIAQIAVQLRVPTISVYRPFVEAGGLMMYGPDTADVFRRSASYVDRVLKGEKPADLPVQQPTKFEFVINARTAKTIGIEVPPRLLFTADEVIE